MKATKIIFVLLAGAILVINIVSGASAFNNANTIDESGLIWETGQALSTTGSSTTTGSSILFMSLPAIFHGALKLNIE